MPQKSTIVLVHGVWVNAAHWSKVILRLSKMGYELCVRNTECHRYVLVREIDLASQITRKARERGAP
jgi:hypothetical protein